MSCKPPVGWYIYRCDTCGHEAMLPEDWFYPLHKAMPKTYSCNQGATGMHETQSKPICEGLLCLEAR